MREKIFFPGKTLCQVIDEIRSLNEKKVTLLDLSGHGLWSSLVLRAYVTALIETEVIHLDLSENQLYKMYHEDLADLIDLLKETSVTHLDLRLNAFWKKSGSELAELAVAFKGTGVTHLSLAGNELGEKTGAELAELAAAFKDTGVTHLSLAGNELGKKTGSELAELAAAFKDTGVTHLDLPLNCLESKSDEEFNEFVKALPDNIVSVGFDYSEVEEMTSFKRQALQHRFGSADNIVLYKNEFDERIDVYNIDIQRFEPSLRREDANAYRALGFNTPIPSLRSSCAFFAAQRISEITCQSTLPSELHSYVGSLRS